MGAVSKEPVHRARFSPMLQLKQLTISLQTAGLCFWRVAVVMLLCESSCLGRRTSTGLWHLNQHVTMDKKRWKNIDKIAVWVFPQKVQAAFSSSCLLRNFSSGLGSTGCLSLCFPLKLFLRSLHLAPKPQFIFHVIFWAAASCKLYMWKRRWEGKEGEVTMPKPLPFWIVQYAVSLFFYFLFKP